MTIKRSYAILDETGNVPTEQLANATGAHPNLAAHDALGLATQAELDAVAGAPANADYLVGTAHTGLSAEIVVGTSPGGELGGTWASPTVDATHSGSTHAAAQAAAEATAAAALAAHEADTTAVHGITNTAALSLTSHDHNASYEATGAVATHAGLADPHTGYRLESADHSHASTGLQGGTIAHSATTGQTANDHHAQAHVIGGADHTASGLTIGHVLRASGATAFAFAAIADGDLPSTIARDTEVATAVSDHAALADPHPGYLTSAEGDAAYQPVDSDLTAIAALTTTAFGRGLLALADAAALAANHTHSGASTAYAPGSFTVATGNYALMVKRLQLTTTQRSTLQGTAQLRIT